MLPPFTRDDTPLLWTNFSCSFTWLGCQALRSTASKLIPWFMRKGGKNHPKIAQKCKFKISYTGHNSILTPNSKISANFGPENTLLTQHSLSGSYSRVCQRTKQNCLKNDHFLLPHHSVPELLSMCVQNMTKYGLGWFLGIGRKALDHLSQKKFSESADPKLFIRNHCAMHKWWLTQQ